MSAVVVTDTRERILRETLELIGRDGIVAVTNRRVASAAEVSLGSLTYHFDSQVELVRESLLLLVGEEVERLEAITADLRTRRPGIEEIAAEISAIAGESAKRIQQIAEIELHLKAARDPELRDASRRCFEAYEGVATAALELLGVEAEAAGHARSVIAVMYGMALRRLGTGEEDPVDLSRALLSIVRGATP